MTLQGAVLGVFQRQVGEHPLQKGQLSVITALQPRQRNALCLDVLRPCAGIVAIEIARKLIKKNQQREPARGRGRPVVQLIACGLDHRCAESLANLLVKVGVRGKPVRPAGIGKPEVEYVLRGNWVFQRSISCWAGQRVHVQLDATQTRQLLAQNLCRRCRGVGDGLFEA
jgi:hypothetical protein